MQNHWFRNPERIEAALSRYGDDGVGRERYRRRLIEYALFAGCKSGQMLKRHLGEDLCDRITWEEASREIGSHASSVFPADVPRLCAVIEELQPRMIVTFGEVAIAVIVAALHRLKKTEPFIHAPHPAAHRGAAEGLQIARKLIDAHLAIAAPVAL